MLLRSKMHVLQPKHTKLKEEEIAKILQKHNLALAQLPKISKKDPALPEGCKTGDVVKIERMGEFAEVYYRIVI
jgi:DNA-directed RNA polymerase subunit H